MCWRRSQRLGGSVPAWASNGPADSGSDGSWRRAIPGTLVVGGGAANGNPGAVAGKRITRKEGRHKLVGRPGALELFMWARLT